MQLERPGKITVGGPSAFHIGVGEVSESLLGAGSPERTLRRLLERWNDGGNLRSGAFYLKRACGWAKLAFWPGERANNDQEVSRALRRVLAMPSLTPDGRPSPMPHCERDLLCYSLGSAEEEIARLVLEVKTPIERPELSTHLFTCVSLYLSGLKGREQGDTVALRGDLARRLFLSRETPVDLEGESWRRQFPEIIGRSRKMKELLQIVRRVAPTDVSVLIQGESGTGKELVGRAIHRLSRRAERPFVSENCAAFPENLLEGEVFGSEKGAYTGSDRTRPGLIERSNGGTLFLDEIGEMGPALQSKLLRVIQEREVRRVGGAVTIPVDFRLITATHRDLDEEAKEGRFREDLLFRIRVIPIVIPPLRERREDIPVLVNHFLTKLSGSRGLPLPVLHPEAEEMLANHDWPGNVRELQNELERAFTLTPDVLTPESLSPRFEHPILPGRMARRVRSELGADIYSLERVVLGGVIQDVLEETGGNKARAARILGIPKSNLYRRLQRYGLKA